MSLFYNKTKPLAIDLYAGLGGWTEGLLAEGYRVVGFDIERHRYEVPARVNGGQVGTCVSEYPAQLVLQDVLTLHGSQFRNAALIVASPPCCTYSYMAMPWKRGKAMAAEIRQSSEKIGQLNALFDACFRIQREASEAAGRHIPMVVENVKGAQPWVGRAAWHYGSFYLWGDVPALMPPSKFVKLPGNDTFKANGLPCNKFTDPRYGSGVKQHGHSGRAWFADPDVAGHLSSHSSARKAASAQIAKIPFELASWVARCYYVPCAESK